MLQYDSRIGKSCWDRHNCDPSGCRCQNRRTHTCTNKAVCSKCRWGWRQRRSDIEGIGHETKCGTLIWSLAVRIGVCNSECGCTVDPIWMPKRCLHSPLCACISSADQVIVLPRTSSPRQCLLDSRNCS